MTKISFEPSDAYVGSPNGRRALVLGARHDNIGGSICRELQTTGWRVDGDDCKVDGSDRYEAPPGSNYAAAAAPDRLTNYEDYDACIITLGVTHMEPFDRVSKHNFRRIIEGSLMLPLECARRYVQARDPDGIGDRDITVGTLVFIGSYAHGQPFTHCTSYCTAKAGLDMAARGLAWELMPLGFRVFIVHPHHVNDTPMTRQIMEDIQRGHLGLDYTGAEEYQMKDVRRSHLIEMHEIGNLVTKIVNDPVMDLLAPSIDLYAGVRGG